MKTLLEVLQDAEHRRAAVGHFNFSELTVLKAVGQAARELDTAVVVGVSESEREFVGVREAVALVKAMRDEGLRIFLNADHTHTLEKAEPVATVKTAVRSARMHRKVWECTARRQMKQAKRAG